MLLALLHLADAGVAHAGNCRIGSFSKSTGTAPVTQNVAHGLGETPSAIILWTAARISTSILADANFSFGFSDGTTHGSASGASEDNVTTMNATRRMADKALTIVNFGESLLAEADLDSWDATNFTLNWTTNNATAYVIHFIAIGGTGVSATVLSWAMRTSTGNQSVTGIGFQPDVVLHIHAGGGFTSTPPASTGNWGFGIGAMDRDGNQWANTGFSVDSSADSDTQGYQRTNKTIVAIDSTPSVIKEATYVSMDSDGFTLNWGTANSSASRVYSLALAGVDAWVGDFLKTTGAATASQSVTDVPFRPDVVLFASQQDTAQTTPQAHNRFGVGAMDYNSGELATAYQDTDGLGTSSNDDVQKTTKAFVKMNNNTPSIDAEADGTSTDAAGFTLSWTTNDSVQTEMLYLAFRVHRRIRITRPGLLSGPG